MKAVIAGGTGFLGSALAGSFRADGHHVTIISRHPHGPDQVAWTDRSALDGADVVVNLAGTSLDSGRWTDSRKAEILDSRVQATETIVKAMSEVSRRPAMLLNQSAVGFYGAHGSESLTEESPPGSDFLASVCVAWEAAATKAAWMTRVVLLRTGLPLDASGGALPRLALPFRFFAGGRLGSGEQYWSWIHIHDWIRMVRWAIEQPDINGPLNATAPAPATNRELADALGRALRRPAFTPAPAIALRLLLGEMADALILSGQRVLPAKATRSGFEFRYPDLESALRQIYRQRGKGL
jgi:uncharacterized protein (TIGR01777 family)